MRRALTRSGLAVVNAPFRECVVLSLRSRRFCAEDRGSFSEVGQFPFGKPLTGVVRPRMFCITTGLVQLDSYFGIARLVLLVTMHLVLCFFPFVRPELLGIMAGMDQEAWACVCAWPGLSWCLPFAGLVRDMLAALLFEVSLFLSVFRVCPTFIVLLLLFAAVCTVLGSRSCGSHRSLWRYKVSRRPSACLPPGR